MGLHGDPVAQVIFDGVHVGPDRRIGAEGQGMAIALHALDNGRLGIAAAATGLAQSALDAATAYAMERAPVREGDHRVPGPRLPARRHGGRGDVRSGGLPVCRAAQGRGSPLHEGGVGREARGDRRGDEGDHRCRPGLRRLRLHPDFPVERYMREAKVTQIFEGTNQIQRLVISRQLQRERG
jgi:alkylation response protein AidB-like acyl-CoA dehydrogenase